ncbi:MAG: hypothetical protein JJU42_16430 [Rhodobacteraceae bacterium]|nr:hypothetical protein [Paracoccaceae bacterium]
MHIVTASDDTYAIGVMVLIASAQRHNPQARFTVLTTGWQAASVAALEAMQARLGCRLDRIDVAADRLERLNIRRAHLSRATALRLLIPDLMPEAGRVIYMDCDMVVTGALDDAWRARIAEGQLLAAVPCPTPTADVCAALGLQKGSYFNAGLLVFDVDTWRRAEIGRAGLRKLSDPSNTWLKGDEATLNAMCGGIFRKLPSGLNVYANESVFQPAFNRPDSIRVIHFTITPKPWMSPRPFGAIWHHEAAPISDLLPPVRPRPMPLRARLRHWNGARRFWMGWAAQKPDYREAFRIRRYVRDTLVPGYLAHGSMAAVPPPAPPFTDPA